MLQILNVEERIDKHGKSYKYILLHSPEHTITVLRNNVKKQVKTPSSTCGYVAYKINYAESQTSDPQYDLKEGDEVPGRIVREKVQPYIANGQFLTTCKVPVFCEEDDLLLFQIEKEKAFKRAGKILVSKENMFGDMFKKSEEQELPTELKIPPGCLIIEELY